MSRDKAGSAKELYRFEDGGTRVSRRIRRFDSHVTTSLTIKQQGPRRSDPGKAFDQEFLRRTNMRGRQCSGLGVQIVDLFSDILSGGCAWFEIVFIDGKTF